MATVSTPVRQPFGILDESKLRGLQSIKNRQNALTPSSAPVKRRAPSLDVSDSENVDPSFQMANIKRKRASLDDDISIAKASRLQTYVTPRSTVLQAPTRGIITPTHRTESASRLTVTPLSAPAAAGHISAREKRIPSKRRFAPPSLNSRSPSLSLAAALKGTLAHKSSRSVRHEKKSRTAIEESTPNSWFFDIFEETEEVQDYRMGEWTMTQSSAALEISDDEGKSIEKSDKGKENVDPNAAFASAPVTRSMAAAAAAQVSTEVNKDDMNTEEPRTPLGDLNASEFYGEGLNATSVVLVHDDDHDDEPDQQEAASQEETVSAPSTEDFTFEATVEAVPEWAQKSASSSAGLESFPSAELVDDVMPVPSAEPSDIQIWESESAKDAGSPCHIADEDQENSASGFCLQEL